MDRCRLRPPCYMVEFLHVLHIHDAATTNMPYLDPIIHSQSRTRSRRENVLAVGTPFAHACVTRLDGTKLLKVFFEVVNIHLSRKVPKSSYQNETSMWGEHDGISRTQGKSMHCLCSVIEDDRLGRHVTIDYAELLGLGRPGNVVDGSILVCAQVSMKFGISTRGTVYPSRCVSRNHRWHSGGRALSRRNSFYSTYPHQSVPTR